MGKNERQRKDLPAPAPAHDPTDPTAAPRPGAQSGVFARESTSALVGELYRAHGAFVLALVERAGVHPDAAERIVVATFATVEQKIDAREVLAHPRGYLRAIAVGHLRNHLRDPRLALERAIRRAEALDDEALPESDPDPEGALLRTEQRAQVREVIEDLPPSKGALLADLYLNERTPASIAAQRGVPVHTLYAKIRRAEEWFERIFKARFKGVFFLGVIAIVLAGAAATWRAAGAWPTAAGAKPAKDAAATMESPR